MLRLWLILLRFVLLLLLLLLLLMRLLLLVLLLMRLLLRLVLLRHLEDPGRGFWRGLKRRDGVDTAKVVLGDVGYLGLP